jgi:cytochrome P450
MHGRKRRIISQGFSDSALRSAEPFILDKVRKLCDALYMAPKASGMEATSIWSGKMNMAKWGMLTFSILTLEDLTNF